MSNILDILQERILLGDGATGSLIQNTDLDLERDYQGKENCSEILNFSNPDFVRGMHRTYLAAGSDFVLTNSFGGSSVTLDEFDLGAETEAINRRAGELAQEAVAEFSGDGRQRFVAAAA